MGNDDRDDETYFDLGDWGASVPPPSPASPFPDLVVEAPIAYIDPLSRDALILGGLRREVEALRGVLAAARGVLEAEADREVRLLQLAAAIREADREAR